MNELAKVMEKLNQTILTQQQKIEEQGVATVSYTHLDVYKRQLFR